MASARTRLGWLAALVVAACMAFVADVVFAQANQPPSASFTYSPASPTPGVEVTFTSTSSDPDGRISNYEWDLDGDNLFGEAGEPTGPSATAASRSFPSAGSYIVRLRVTDGDGAQAVASETVTVSEAPPGPGPPGPQRLELTATRTTLHGPVVLRGREFARFRPPPGLTGEVGEEGGEGVGCTALCGEGAPEALTTPFSPRLTISWDAPIAPSTNKKPVIDPQIAAGPSYLLVTLRHRFFIIDKAGNLAWDKTGTKQLGEMSICDLFDPLSPSINASLNLPPPLTVADGYGIDCDADPSAYYDARAVFDGYRNRYWITAIVVNRKCCDLNDPLEEQGRREKFAVAVSKTSDPRGDWYLYWTDAVVNDGHEPLCPNGSCPVEVKADYPSIGISPKYVALTTASGTFNDTAPDGTPNKDTTTIGKRVVLGPADALAAGCPGSCPAWAFDDLPEGPAGFSDFPNPDGSHLGFHIEPAVHHGPVEQGGFLQGGFFLAYTHLDESKPEGDPAKYHLVVWVLFPPDPPPPENVVAVGGVRIDVPVAPWLNVRNLEQPPSPEPPSPAAITTPFKVEVGNLNDNIGPILLKLAYRDGLLYATFQDCASPKVQASCHAAIRLIRVPVFGSGQKVDDTFGTFNPADPPGTIADYGMPAVEVNKDGNAAVTYIRAGKTGKAIFPEARYSVLYGSEGDVRPGRALQEGDYTLGTENTSGDPEAVFGRFDISGISVDGFDDTGIWMLAPYSTKIKDGHGRWQLAAGKVFGKRHPDLQIERVRRKLRAGKLSVKFRVRNLGDGAALPTKIRLSLVPRARSARASRKRVLRLKTVKLRRVRTGRTRAVRLRLRLPSARRRRGLRFLRVQLDPGRRLREYAERNNTFYLRLSAGRR